MPQVSAHIPFPTDQLLNNMNTAVFLADGQLRITFANSAAEQLVSASDNKLRGVPLFDYLRFPTAFETRLMNHMGTSQCYVEREVRVTLPHDRRELLIDCSVTYGPGNAINPDNYPDDYTGNNRQWALFELTDSGHHARLSREQALLVQQQASDTLLHELAHEIRNPLGGLRGAAQLLESELPDKALLEYTRIIVGEADRLQALLDRLLGPGTWAQRSEVNIHETLEYVKTLVCAETDNSIIFQADYDPSIPHLWAERDWLVQLFLNITRNAVQAIGEEGTVTFKTRIQRAFTIRSVMHKLVAAVHIIDDGPGIPASVYATLFYPMVSARNGGNGLGLSIAQRLAGQLNGLIEAVNEPGRTVFTIYLPLSDSDQVP